MHTKHARRGNAARMCPIEDLHPQKSIPSELLDTTRIEPLLCWAEKRDPTAPLSERIAFTSE